jgi:hypothetical protein
MHHPPDLSLASSYIPACLCLLKSTLVFILFIFAPVRGWITLIGVLLSDRILWNQSANSTILDVNAVCVSLVGGLMVMHARSDGVKTLVHFGITGMWILLSSVQVLGLTRLHRTYEVLFAAFSVSVLSCLYQAQERTELLALRSFVFVVANATLPYLGVMLQHPNIDTYVNACRTLLILLGEPEVASGWLTVYILCMGYQVRNTGGGVHIKKMQHAIKFPQNQGPYYHSNEDDYDEEEPLPTNGCVSHRDHPSAAMVFVTKNTPPPSASNMSSQQPSITASNTAASAHSIASANGSSPSEEAALLREALASRKGFRDA